MLYIYCICLPLLLILNAIVYRSVLNMPNLLTVEWLVLSILSMFGLYDCYIPPDQVYYFILTFILIFNILSMVLYKIKIYIPHKHLLINPVKEKENIQWDLMDKVIKICCIIMLPILIKSMLLLLRTRSLGVVRDSYLNSDLIGNKAKMLITLLITPASYAAGIYLIVDYIDNRKFKSSLAWFIILTIETLFATAGRNKIVFLAVIIAVALLDKYKNDIVEIVKDNKKIVGALSGMILIVLAITLKRNLSGKGIFFNIYAYFAGAIHLFGVYLSEPTKYLLDGNNLLWGQVLFSGIIYPFTFVLRLLGSDIKAGVYIINEVTQEFIHISPTTKINNNVTFLYAALRDFGKFGVPIYSVLLSISFVYLYKRKERNPILKNKVMYFYFLQNLFFIIFDFNFAIPSTFFTFVYIILFNKKIIFDIDIWEILGFRDEKNKCDNVNLPRKQ